MSKTTKRNSGGSNLEWLDADGGNLHFRRSMSYLRESIILHEMSKTQEYDELGKIYSKISEELSKKSTFWFEEASKLEKYNDNLLIQKQAPSNNIELEKSHKSLKIHDEILKKSEKKDVIQLKREAENGEIEAQCILGFVFFTSKAFYESSYWFKKAAEIRSEDCQIIFEVVLSFAHLETRFKLEKEIAGYKVRLDEWSELYKSDMKYNEERIKTLEEDNKRLYLEEDSKFIEQKNFYEKLFDDLTGRIEALGKEIETLKVRDIEKENSLIKYYKERVEALEKEIETLRARDIEKESSLIKYYEERIEALEKEAETFFEEELKSTEEKTEDNSEWSELLELNLEFNSRIDSITDSLDNWSLFEGFQEDIKKEKTEEIGALIKKQAKQIKWYEENAIYIPKQELKLPEKAPMLWVDYKKLNPENDIPDFLMDVWGEYLNTEHLSKNVLYQDDFTKRDPQGMNRLKYYCNIIDKSKKVADYIPPKTERIKKEISFIPAKTRAYLRTICTNIKRHG